MIRSLFRNMPALALTLGLVACTTTGTTTEEAFQSYANALGTNDIEGMMSMYSNKASWTVDDRVFAEDAESLRRSHAYEQGLGSVRTVARYEVDGDRVRAFETETNDFFCVFGVDQIETLTVYRFKNGRVRAVETVRDPEGLARMAPEVTRFFQWLETHHYDFCSTMFAEDGSFIGAGEQGARLVELAQEWKSQQG